MDDELFKDSYDNLANKVLGERSRSRALNRDVLSVVKEVMDYYNYPMPEIPHGITEPIEIIDYSAGSVGMMSANIELHGKWYTDCFGPIIAFLKEGDIPVTLYPMGFARYYYYDVHTGKKVIIRKKTSKLFKTEAIGFYEPMPLKKLSITDLIFYMRKRLNIYDYLYYIVVSLILAGISMILPKAAQILTGDVLSSGDFVLYWGITILIIVTLLMAAFMRALSGAVEMRLKYKIMVPVDQAVMQRILTLPAPFFREYSAGELENRSSSVSTICEILVEDAFSMTVSAVVSLVYLFQIASFAPALMLPSIIIILLTVLFMCITMVMQTRVSRQRMEIMAKESGLTYAIINGIQKIKLAGAEKRIFAKWANQYAEEAALAYNPPFFLKISSALTTGISLLFSCCMGFPPRLCRPDKIAPLAPDQSSHKP